MNSNKIILDLCGGTGSWSKPYKDAGYDVRLVTMPENDVRTYVPPPNVYGILAAPPCDEFSIAKNHNIKRDIEKGMETVRACLRIVMAHSPKFWAMENPAGKLRGIIGEPTLSFQPYEYGDGWTKRTFIWGKFNRPVKQYVRFEQCPQLPGGYIRPGRKTVSIAFNHVGQGRFFPQLAPFLKDCKTDAAFRAITPPAFAKAFFEANQ